jgi:hypothetical protein
MSVVLDAGALIALDRNDRIMWTAIAAAARRAIPIVVPSTTIAQAWRDGARQARLATALSRCVIASFDHMARGVGELCGRAGINDICDAHVAIVAAGRADVLYTSDPDDLRRLIDLCAGRRPVIIEC